MSLWGSEEEMAGKVLLSRGFRGLFSPLLRSPLGLVTEANLLSLLTFSYETFTWQVQLTDSCFETFLPKERGIYYVIGLATETDLLKLPT